jgi:hypothetical protein
MADLKLSEYHSLFILILSYEELNFHLNLWETTTLISHSESPLSFLSSVLKHYIFDENLDFWVFTKNVFFRYFIISKKVSTLHINEEPIEKSEIFVQNLDFEAF